MAHNVSYCNATPYYREDRLSNYLTGSLSSVWFDTLAYTHGPVIVGFESVVTNAVETSNSVDTLPMAADIGDFLTFIPIWKQRGAVEVKASKLQGWKDALAATQTVSSARPDLK